MVKLSSKIKPLKFTLRGFKSKSAQKKELSQSQRRQGRWWADTSHCVQRMKEGQTEYI
jgi:hypothetical protein